MDIGFEQRGGFVAGDVLAGRYRVVGKLGAGGMATIFRAWDLSLERDVAIKVVHPHLADDPGVLERFKVEARQAARLLHPHIVTVFDQGTAGLPYIVMEYVDGPSLRDVLCARERLSPEETLAVVEPVCVALQRAHRAGVVHRDVKPENVLITLDGTPKVADFGIARALAATSHTQTGTIIGSVHYLAPELVNGREATPASDQYAVGVLLFELLTGRQPLPADTPMAVALRHARERVPAPGAHVRGTPRALDRVVARATALDPAKRYPDLAALVADLRGAVPAGPAPLVVDLEENASHGWDRGDWDGDEDADGTLVVPPDAQETVSVAAAADLAARHRRSVVPRRVRRLVIPLLVALVAAASGYVTWDLVVAPVTAVPEVEGLPLAQADAVLAEDGFDTAVADEREHSLEVPEDAVLHQQPAAGTGLRRGGVVHLVLSAGPRTVEMPRVTGMPETEAVALLRSEEHRFEVTRHEEHSDHVPKGVVQGQQPEPGTDIHEGSTVVINVSLGIEQVQVPELVGLSRERAEERLERAKLRAAVEGAYSDDVPAGRVIRQSLDPGTTTDKGTAVTIVVSQGPSTVEVPNVQDLPVAQAREKLEAVGLAVRVHEQAQPRVGPFAIGRVGHVYRQTPSAGKTVKRGSVVTLYTFK